MSLEFGVGGPGYSELGGGDENGIIIKWNSPYTSMAAEGVAQLILEFAILVIATFLLY